jgi:hypothetical protein
LKRREYLKKYCESGESDYPFTIKINSITNLTAILFHIMDDEYKFDMILMNFKKDKKDKKNYFDKVTEKLTSCFNKCKSKKGDEKETPQKEIDHQKSLKKKRNTTYLKEKKTIEKLNFMNFDKNCEEINLSKNKLGSSEIVNNNLKEYFKSFSKVKPIEENDEILNFDKEVKRNISDQNNLNPFNLIFDDYLNFLPVHINLEVSLVYGMNCIRLMRTRCSIIKEDIIINEKINFSQFKMKGKPSADDEKKEKNKDYKFLYVKINII